MKYGSVRQRPAAQFRDRSQYRRSARWPCVCDRSLPERPRLLRPRPVEAVNRALAEAGRAFAELDLDLDLRELNEAFAAQVLGCLAAWPEFDTAILNPQGGAITLGHSLGASGARQLAGRGTGTGVATPCIGAGQELALALER